MKFVFATLAAALAFTFVVPDDASAKSRKGYRTVKVEKHYRYYGRPASVQANGLCQRDTGTATGNLNFRNRCDTEEFWTRTFERGFGRR